MFNKIKRKMSYVLIFEKFVINIILVIRVDIYFFDIEIF